MNNSYDRNQTFFRYEDVTATKSYYSDHSKCMMLNIYIRGQYFEALYGRDREEFEKGFTVWKRSKAIPRCARCMELEDAMEKIIAPYRLRDRVFVEFGNVSTVEHIERCIALLATKRQ